jgi:adenosylmethionine---8-amino-7-oxononanoate aminotransferase
MESFDPLDLVSRDRACIWHPFTPRDERSLLAVKSARGAWLELENGGRVLDAIGSWWLTVHGHSHPLIALAVAQQASQLEHVLFAGFTHEPAVRLAERLCRLLPGEMSRIFFSDDGSTSTEVALKIALQYFHNIGAPRTHIVALEGGYHGDTFGAMSASSPTVFNAPFQSKLFSVTHLPCPADHTPEAVLAALDAAIAESPVAAIILEPLVQGVAGMKIYGAELLTAICQRVHEAGGLVIADEVMTGFGRTGTLFAMSQSHEPADMICLSKGLTGGALPMGITACTEVLYQAFQSEDKHKTFFHGHSYTANPIACAAANASLDLFELESTCDHLERITQAQKAAALRLKNLPKVSDARSIGVILAVEFSVEDAGYLSTLGPDLYKFFLDRDVLLRPLGNVIYAMPPLCTTDKELEMIYGAIEEFARQ